MPKGYNQKTFEEAVKKVHGDKIDLSNFKYMNSITPSEAKCNICGNIWHPRPDVLLRGHGCRKCYDKKNSESRKIPFKEIQEKIGDSIKLTESTYIDTKHKCEATCQVCGHVWYPNVNDLLNNHSCPNCYKNENLKHLQGIYERRAEEAKSKFIEDARKKYGDRYDYSKVDYKTMYTEVCIISKEHGEFWMTPKNHLKWNGYSEEEYRKEEFIRKANEKYNFKFDYSKVDYKGIYEKVCIICHEKDENGEEHGEFWQSPAQHLKTCHGCPKCTPKNKPMPIEEAKKKVEEVGNVHGYELDWTTYKNFMTPIRAFCEKHGEFLISPFYLAKNFKCPKCTATHRLDTDEFIEKARKIHGDKYDYSESEYVNNRTRVKIICHKKDKRGVEHGAFWQTPNDHLDGCGCPLCQSSRLENDVRIILEENKVEFSRQVGKRTVEFLDTLTLDFYIPSKKIGIECQGEQHFVEVAVFGGEEGLRNRMENDERKKRICQENGVKLIYYLDKEYNKYMKEDDIYFNNVEDLITYINQ